MGAARLVSKTKAKHLRFHHQVRKSGKFEWRGRKTTFPRPPAYQGSTVLLKRDSEDCILYVSFFSYSSSTVKNTCLSLPVRRPRLRWCSLSLRGRRPSKLQFETSYSSYTHTKFGSLRQNEVRLISILSHLQSRRVLVFAQMLILPATVTSEARQAPPISLPMAPYLRAKRAEHTHNATTSSASYMQ